jgi:3-hydroxybutyryl-CoA dehydratase
MSESVQMSDTQRDFSLCYGYDFDELEVGMSAAVGRTVSEADILMFAGVSGDTNPVHVDEEFAASTMFGGRIAHGMLSASYVSTVFGTKLPGPGCIYLSQSLRFKAPVKVGDTVEARVTVTELNVPKRRAKFSTVCTVAGKVVLDGEAEIMIPAR